MKDPVRELLKKHGASEPVVRGGLEGLVVKWEKTANDVAGGYKFDLDNYLNDVDVRQLIDDVLNNVPGQSPELLKRIEGADELMRRSTNRSKCVWGGAAASREGWSAEKNWWYFGVPKELSEML